MKRYIFPALTLLLAAVAMSFVHPKETDQLAWDPAVKLTWDDFKGAAEEASTEKAFAHTLINYNYKLQKEAIHVEVVCCFERSLSWVSAEKSAKTTARLKHEQLHFDMAELMARKIRKEISAYVSKDIPKTQAYIDQVNDQYFKTELGNLTKAYDTETNFGATESKQKKWETKIAGELKKLGAFTATKVEIQREKN